MNLYSIIKEVRTFAQAKGLNVVLEQNCKCPRTDGKTMYIPVPKSNFTEEELILWRHSCLHEAGHNDPRARDCFELAHKLKLNMQSFMGTCINLIDDNRNEKFDIDILAGKRLVMDKGNAILRKRLIENGFHTPHEDKRMRIVQTLCAWDCRERMNWLPSLGTIYGELKDIADEEQQEWLARLEKYDARLASLTTAQEEWDLLCEILQSVFDYTDEELEEEKQQSTQAQGDGEGEGSGESGKGAGEGESGEGTEGNERGEARTKHASVKYSDILTHKHEDQEGGSYSSLSIVYEEGDYVRGRGFNVDLSPKIINYPKGESPTGRVQSSYYDEKVWKDFSGYSFSNKLKKLLQVRAQSLEVHGLKRGKFDRKNIYRAGMVDAGGYSERIFKETITNNILDRAVSVMVDCSGSMGGYKYVHAIRCAVLLNESLGKLNVPVEIVGFTDSDRAFFPIFKSFDKKIDSHALSMYMSNFGEWKMSNNSDGEALMFAENRLLARKERGKLLIMLSDGAPASYRGDAYSHTIDVVKRMENEGRFDLIAVGIEDDTVKNIYTRYKIIDDSSKLEAAVIDILKTNILTA